MPLLRHSKLINHSLNYGYVSIIPTTIEDNNNIGDSGAIAIADALKINATLTIIYLGIYHAFYNPY
jgi:hypothetical protein